MSGRIRFTILAAALVLAQPAVSAAQPAGSAPGVEQVPERVCPEVDPEDRSVYAPVGDSARQFFECSNGVPYLFTCPDGLLFNSTLDVCDWPENAIAVAAPTRTAIEGPNSEEPFARVTWGGNMPLYRAQVTFTHPDGTFLCTAYTDDTGRATCEDLILGDEARYTATYPGTDTLTGSTTTTP